MRNRWWAAAGLAAAAVVLTACGSTASSSAPKAPSSSSAPAAASSGTVVKTESTSKGMVLADSAGLTLYWFAIDTPTKSNCNGTCATFWPPVQGQVAAGSSLPGTFGTITRADGSTQLTYDSRPLYTFKQDTAPGQINGNGLDTAGGFWFAATPGGAKLASAPKPKSSSSSGGGGYGY